MRRRPLPFVKLLNSLDPAAQIARKNDAMHALLRCEGVQLFFDALGDVESRILTVLSTGTQTPERCAGGLEAIEMFRRLLWDLYPKKEAVQDLEPEEEYELDDNYESPFNLPPSQASPVSES